EDQIKSRVASTDANDMLYQYNSSRDYDPSTSLEKIKAAVLAINSADDVVNPPELGLMEKLMPRVKSRRTLLIPTTHTTPGHGTHSLAAVCGSYLADFIRSLDNCVITSASARPASPAIAIARSIVVPKTIPSVPAPRCVRIPAAPRPVTPVSPASQVTTADP